MPETARLPRGPSTVPPVLKPDGFRADPAGMEQAEPQATETPVRIRGAWTQLTLELSVLSATAALLAMVAGQIPDSRPDAGFVLALALLLHASGFVRFARRAADFLDIECPRCSESFHGMPDRLPRPFRSRCAHCGAHA